MLTGCGTMSYFVVTTGDMSPECGDVSPAMAAIVFIRHSLDAAYSLVIRMADFASRL